MSMLRALGCDDVRELAPFFVLDALAPAEMAAVRAHLASCREPHPELAELGGVVGYLAQLPAPVEPPEAVGDRIRAAVRADVRASDRDLAAAERLVGSLGGGRSPEAREARPAVLLGVPPAPSGEQSAALAAGRARSRRLIQSALAVAAAVALVALGAWNVSLQGSLSDTRARVTVLQQAISASTEAGSRVAHLKGSGPAAGASGVAVITAGGTAYVVIDGLAPAPAGRTYEAWFGAANVMRPAGLLTVGSDGLAILAGASDAHQPVEVVALTIEPAGGSKRPTSAPIVVGTVRS